MKIYKITSLTDYDFFASTTADEYFNKHLPYINNWIPDASICNETLEEKINFDIGGFSYTAGKNVDFKNSFVVKNGVPEVNWREGVICPVTGLNNRTRASVHVFDIFSNIYDDEKIYIMEQSTPLYRFLKSRHLNLIGSEYLGGDVPLGSTNDFGVLNQDATNLTFEDCTISAILSLDVLEHIYEYRLALQECFRVLRGGGSLFFTVPFAANSDENIERAVISNGQINHILPPEYHGDPLSMKGILCYTYFGWNILSDLKKIGYINPCALIFRSETFGYFTNQVVFYCTKPNV